MSDDTTANGAALTEAERKNLLDAKDNLLDRSLIQTVERLLAARVAPLLAERDALRGKVAAVEALTSVGAQAGSINGRPYILTSDLLAALDAPAAAQPEREPRAGADHGEWSIRIYDDQPVPEGKKYAPDNRVVVLRHGAQVREFLYPAYRIWTLLAHWTESLDDLAVESAATHPTTPHGSDQGERGRA